MLLGGVPAQAQIDPDELPTEAREQFEAFKIAFFTRRLSLSSEEAKRFWPVYDRYTEALSSIRRKQRIKRLEMKDAYDGDSEERLEQLADEYISITTSEADVRQQFHTEFKTVLPIRKVLLLYKAEQDFKRELLEEIRQRRQGRGGRFRH
jgi:hypothetical protein